jgi:hypothetical protein
MIVDHQALVFHQSPQLAAAGSRWPAANAHPHAFNGEAVMEYRQLGRSGFTVPALSLGAGTFEEAEPQ